MQECCQTDLSVFELKKKLERERDTEARCVAVHAIDGNAEEIDLKLRNLSFDKFDTLSYYSCINGSAEQ